MTNGSHLLNQLHHNVFKHDADAERKITALGACICFAAQKPELKHPFPGNGSFAISRKMRASPIRFPGS